MESRVRRGGGGGGGPVEPDGTLPQDDTRRPAFSDDGLELVGGDRFSEISPNGAVAWKSPDDGGGMLILLLCSARLEGPGLGGREPSLLSES